MDNSMVLSQIEQYRQLSTKRNECMSDSSYQTLSYYMGSYLRYLGNGKIDKQSIADYLIQSNLAQTSKNTVIKSLGAFLSWYGYISIQEQQALAAKFKGISKMWSSEPLTDDLVAEILEASSKKRGYFVSVRDPAIFMLLATIGVRVSQATNLLRADMVDTGDYIEYKVPLLKENKLSSVIQRKSSIKRVSKERMIGNLCHYDIIAKWLKIHDGNSDYFFYSSQAPQMKRRQIEKICSNMSEVIGVRIKPHSFRHYVATKIAKQHGIERAAVALDHVNIMTTQRYLNPDALSINM